MFIEVDTIDQSQFAFQMSKMDSPVGDDANFSIVLGRHCILDTGSWRLVYAECY
jgi:hypothetical protein